MVSGWKKLELNIEKEGFMSYEATEEAQSLLTLYDINRLLGRDSSRRLPKFVQ